MKGSIAGTLGLALVLGTVVVGAVSTALELRRAPEPAEGAVVPSVEASAVEEPAAAAPVPVLLVPGWLDTGRDLAALRIRLIGAGWQSSHVETLTFAEPTGSNRDHATELGAALTALMARTGASEVDLVSHSMGGLAVRWYLMSRPEAPVRRVVFVASPHRGTLSAHLSWGGGREEMMPESPFLDTLNASAPAPAGVESITIRTTVDTHIVPGESATLPGVSDHEICCPTHAGMLRDEEVFAIVRRFLGG